MVNSLPNPLFIKAGPGTQKSNSESHEHNASEKTFVMLNCQHSPSGRHTSPVSGRDLSPAHHIGRKGSEFFMLIE